MKRYKRWRVIVDPKLQAMLCLRAVIYCLCCFMTAGITLMIGSAARDILHLSSHSSVFSPDTLIGIILALLVLSIILVDILIASNRFAGPLRRLQKQMQQVAKGGPAASLQIRNRDYYPQLVQAWNSIVKELNELRQQSDTSHHGRVEMEPSAKDDGLTVPDEKHDGSKLEDLMSAASS